jgi:hypothetical protein
MGEHCFFGSIWRQAPSWRIVTPVEQAAFSKRHLVAYVTPSEPHTGRNSREQSFSTQHAP